MLVGLILSCAVSLTTVKASCTSFAVRHRIWIRVQLPAEELASLRAALPGCDFRRGEDATNDADWLQPLPIFTENLPRFVAGEPLQNIVDKDLGY